MSSKLSSFFLKPLIVSDRKRLNYLASRASGVVLDIGFAQQPNMFIKKNRKVTKLIGMDIQEPKLPRTYDGFVKGDIDKKLPIKDNSFDTVLAGELIEHTKRHIEFIEEIARILNIGGHFVFTTPNAYYPIRILQNMTTKTRFKSMKNYELNHYHLFPQKALQEIFHAKGFKLSQIKPSLIASNLMYDFVLVEKKEKQNSSYEKGGTRFHRKGEKAGLRL